MKTQFVVIALCVLFAACDGDGQRPVGTTPKKTEKKDSLAETSAIPADRKAWFGETHVHTSYSVDSSIYNVTSTPDDAYRYARGSAIGHTSGNKIQSARPIDFMAITDHAEYLGIIHRMKNPKDALSGLSLARELISDDEEIVKGAFIAISSSIRKNQPLVELMKADVMISGWQSIIDIAEQHYEPGEFTTFIAYEWTSNPTSRNLHRNIIFRGGREKVPELPFSSFDSQHPEDLWEYMDQLRQRGMPALAIPHNSNLSDGLMFPVETDSWGNALDTGYADTRNRNEPLVEITQIKGSSEVHPALSPNDEWSNFEILEELFDTGQEQTSADLIPKPSGSYIRQAYLDGLQLEEVKGFNPYKFGVVGATDSHNASVPVDENNYTGKIGIADDTPQQRRTGVTAGLTVRKWGGGTGLAGVWAEENTRESIFDAMLRKETFGTSGPRIKVRFFAGWNFPDDAFNNSDWPALAYENGVPMGSELPGGGVDDDLAPVFLAWALKDPDEAPLQRLQVVKGWVDNGKAKEKVFDIACSDNAVPDPASHRCPDNGAMVNLADCSISSDSGDVELARVWRDPEFDGRQRAFYYVRVLQNPTCRWSTWDAIRNGLPLLTDVPPIIQERAWSSPVWHSPN